MDSFVLFFFFWICTVFTCKQVVYVDHRLTSFVFGVTQLLVFLDIQEHISLLPSVLPSNCKHRSRVLIHITMQNQWCYIEIDRCGIFRADTDY